MNQNKKTRIYKKSARLRHTLDIANACGFDYSVLKYPNGGFFDLYQVEKVLATIKTLEMQVAGLSEDKARLIEGLSPHDSKPS